MSQEPKNGELSPLGHNLAERLVRRFGAGSEPEKRGRFYRRLQLVVEVQGEKAYRTIATVAAEAEGARSPDRYFAFSVVRRLSELGLMPRADL